MNKPYVLVVDDDSSIRWVMGRALNNAGYQVKSCDSVDDAQWEIQKQAPDVIVSDLNMPGGNGMHLLNWVGREYPELPVIIMTADSDLDTAIATHETGAFDYLAKPFDLNRSVEVIERALSQQKDSRQLPLWAQAVEDKISAEYLQGNHQTLQQVQKEFEQHCIRVALKLTGGHKQRAAALLGWGRNTLSRKMNQED